ncbi:sugar phosphate isomerase/epimerase family protein [Mumia sp. DW29H23]|uniref:sugar phosphate isomerase/epimerase family protein n=1 Tax=Mumia sp. DW29H23 TaxID=3421241 RepID=UPI003D685E3C
MCYGYDGHGALDEAAERSGMDRRRLLRVFAGTAAAGALALGVPGTAAAAGQAGPDHATGRPGAGRRRLNPNAISIQLYTLRSDLAKDYDGTLRYVAKTGYRKVEQAGYYGRTAGELRRFHDRLGIRTSSSHDGLSSTRTALYEKLDNANTLGQHSLVVPYLASTDPEQWKRWAYQINSEAAAASREGLRYGYHNHAHEFLPLTNGQRPWDIFCAELDPHLVHFEVDLYWIATGAIQSGDGADDVEGYIAEHIDAAPLKVRQYHVKDRNPETGIMCDLGTGHLDFPRIFAHHQVEEYIVENDQPDVTPRQTAEVGYAYLRNLRF